MRNDTILEHTLNSLERNISYTIGDIWQEKENKNEINEILKESYSYIPYGNMLFIEIMKSVRSYLDRRKDDRYMYKFIDAGAGIGIKVIISSIMGFDSIGLEYDDEVLELARKISGEMVIKQNIMTFKDYDKYDIIYYYRPFKDMKKEIKFEKYVEDNMKVGSILIPIYKGYHDKKFYKRFKNINNGNFQEFYVKIK